MQVHVIDSSNSHSYIDELDEHHCLRNKIYIGERKWRALHEKDGREYDQFDLPDAIYLLALTNSGEVAGGTRLLRSTGPTLLSDVFPFLANVRTFERADDVLEWTRFFVAPRFRESGRLCRVGGIVSAALIDYCLQSRVRRLNAVGETWWMPRISTLGWRPRPLGLPHEHDGMSICAWTIDITAGALRTTREVYNLDGGTLVWPGAQRPALAPSGRLQAKF